MKILLAVLLALGTTGAIAQQEPVVAPVKTQEMRPGYGVVESITEAQVVSRERSAAARGSAPSAGDGKSVYRAPVRPPEGARLRPAARLKAEKSVMPMPLGGDKRYLVAAARAKPSSAYTYAIARGTGALKLVGTGPLAESLPYIQLERSGRYLRGASYGANLVSVNPVGPDGRVGEPLQVIPTARNAHAIRTDNTNRFVFVPHLGTDQVFQFVFDEKSGRLSANTPPILQLKQGSGPRHLIVSADNR